MAASAKEGRPEIRAEIDEQGEGFVEFVRS
jgi:hypothetical protein